LISSGIMLLSLVLVSPLTVNMPRWLSPLVFFSDGCTCADFFVLMQAVMMSLGTALVGSAWPSRGGAKGMVSVIAHLAIVLAIATDMFHQADSAWASVVVIIALSSISLSWVRSSFELPEGAPSARRARTCACSPHESLRESRRRFRESVACSTAAIDYALVAARLAFTAAALGYLGSMSSKHDGCGAWNEQLEVEDPEHHWPAGLDLSVSGPQRDRAMDVARATLLLTTFTTLHGVFLAASLLLEFQSSLAESQAKAVRAQADTMVRAVTYVSHHARGPLNAAVLCMALLEMGECPEAISAASISQHQDDGEAWVTDTRVLLRDLQIALESSKQELDDLLLWQRLSLRNTTTLRSWGTFGSSWEQRLGAHFLHH
ncbi:unnamed protein product, partial [Symbiodinium sp. KB8]